MKTLMEAISVDNSLVSDHDIFFAHRSRGHFRSMSNTLIQS